MAEVLAGGLNVIPFSLLHPAPGSADLLRPLRLRVQERTRQPAAARPCPLGGRAVPRGAPGALTKLLGTL